MEKFRTNLGTEIVKCKVIKETNARITYEKVDHSWRTNENETRIETENKVSSCHSWHNTLEEAKSFLIEKHNQKIQGLNNQIEYAKKQIETVASLNVA